MLDSGAVTDDGAMACGCALCAATRFAEQAATAKGVHVDRVTTDADQNVDALISGARWAVTSLSFSFPNSASDYGYRGYLDVRDSFAPVTGALADAVRAALTAAAAVSKLSFTEVAGFADRDADLMFARSAAPDTAFAYLPDNADEGGDAWFNSADYNNPAAGDYAWATVIHEVGHTLGLKHGHEDGGPDGAGALDAAHDSHEFSMMTYSSHVGDRGNYYTNGPAGGPQTLMMMDIAALQRLYGANFGDHAGDDTYSFRPWNGRMAVNGALQEAPAGNVIFRTIWDGGGRDTYDFSAYSTDLAIDLAPGGFVDLDVGGNAQRAGLGGGVQARGHVFNALLHEGDRRSLIENAIAGAGADRISGNSAANRLEGRAGRDTLEGFGGDDTLAGGAGGDAFIFDLRTLRDGDADLLPDLDFAGGDSLVLRGFDGGVFSDSFLAGNALEVTGGGRGATTDSLADLNEVARSGHVDLARGAGNAVEMMFEDRAFSASVALASLGWGALSASFGFAPNTAGIGPVNDSFTAPLGGARMAGGVGEDRLQGAAGPDRLIGGADDDTLKGGGGPDTLKGGAGDDVLKGGGGSDILKGARGADLLKGGGGGDRLFGGPGDDRMIGGRGADRLRGQNGDDALFAGAGADRLFGGLGADRLFGHAGLDRIAGGGGADLLKGGAGNDLLSGQRGADDLVGWRGSDRLAGGLGPDRFIFNRGDGADVILDFQDGVDRIVIGAGASRLADLDIRDAGAHTMIRFADVAIMLKGVDADDLDPSDFMF